MQRPWHDLRLLPTLMLTSDPLGSTPIRFIVGDLVYAREALCNDGGIPDADAQALLAPSGTRGVVVRVGHVEADPRQTLYLVAFEGTDGELGPPIGCLPEELTQENPPRA